MKKFFLQLNLIKCTSMVILLSLGYSLSSCGMPKQSNMNMWGRNTKNKDKKNDKKENEKRSFLNIISFGYLGSSNKEINTNTNINKYNIDNSKYICDNNTPFNTNNDNNRNNQEFEEESEENIDEEDALARIERLQNQIKEKLSDPNLIYNEQKKYYKNNGDQKLNDEIILEKSKIGIEQEKDLKQNNLQEHNLDNKNLHINSNKKIEKNREIYKKQKMEEVKLQSLIENIDKDKKTLKNILSQKELLEKENIGKKEELIQLENELKEINDEIQSLESTTKINEIEKIKREEINKINLKYQYTDSEKSIELLRAMNIHTIEINQKYNIVNIKFDLMNKLDPKKNKLANIHLEIESNNKNISKLESIQNKLTLEIEKQEADLQNLLT